MKTCLAVAVGLLAAGSAQAQIANGSFETGDFAGWVIQDLATPFWPLSVNPAGTVNTFTWSWSNQPTDGRFDVVTGWDGDGPAGPAPIFAAQDAFINGASLAFDYRAAWDLATFGATMDRKFQVTIRPAGGGAPLMTSPILTALAGTMNPDTGSQAGSVDVSAFVGGTYRVQFEWLVPEAFSGPAQATLDNVRLIPAPGSALAMLGGASLGLRRRRR